MRILLVIFAAITLSGCTSMLLGTNTSSETRVASPQSASPQDEAISASIRRQFSADAEVAQFPIGIRTLHGRVTLSGTVGSYAVRDRAIEIASQTNAVGNVDNRLVVNTNL